MTAKEALKIRKTPFDYEHDKPIDYDALGKCIDEALEKQIPKKVNIVKHENRIFSEQDEPYCPSCGEWIGWNNPDDKYCKHCGQCLEWLYEEVIE